MKKSILGYIAQLVLIVFSVVLGLFLSERIEERKKEREASRLLSQIKSEVQENKMLLEYWVPYHSEIVNRTDSLLNEEAFIDSFIEDQSILFAEVLTRGNIMGRTPSSDAWDIAKSHPLIVHFDYEELLILSKIYNQQEMTYEPVPKVIELVLSTDFNAKGQARSNVQSFKTQIREIVSREIQWLNYVEEAEKILERSNE